jgi:hypothetical protein
VGLAFAFNAQPADGPGFFGAAIPAVQQAAAAVTAWPSHDLFATGG